MSGDVFELEFILFSHGVFRILTRQKPKTNTDKTSSKKNISKEIFKKTRYVKLDPICQNTTFKKGVNA